MSRVLVKPELLAPAGNMEKGKMALLYGADAIYLGGKAFSLRAFSGNFSMEEIEEITAFAHDLGKKVYVTVNIFAHNLLVCGKSFYSNSPSTTRTNTFPYFSIFVFTTVRCWIIFITFCVPNNLFQKVFFLLLSITQL